MRQGCRAERHQAKDQNCPADRRGTTGHARCNVSNRILKLVLSAVQIIKNVSALVTPIAGGDALLMRRERPLNRFREQGRTPSPRSRLRAAQSGTNVSAATAIE